MCKKECDKKNMVKATETSGAVEEFCVVVTQERRKRGRPRTSTPEARKTATRLRQQMRKEERELERQRSRERKLAQKQAIEHIKAQRRQEKIEQRIEQERVKAQLRQQRIDKMAERKRIREENRAQAELRRKANKVKNISSIWLRPETIKKIKLIAAGMGLRRMGDVVTILVDKAFSQLQVAISPTGDIYLMQKQRPMAPEEMTVDTNDILILADNPRL